MNIETLKSYIQDVDIQVFDFSEHSKASELYVKVSFNFSSNGFIWEGLVPYHYRRTGIFIETEEELAAYLQEIKPYFDKTASENWIQKEKEYWNKELSGRTTTKPFFDELAKLAWVSSFPDNPNPQRRLQDIKEMGYTIASKPAGSGTKREFMLLPIPRGLAMGYEVFSARFRTKALETLNYLNAFELNSANKAGLLPDHKFPEIRWNEETRSENPDTMTEEEIKTKFQLIDNQRNQQKREVCRKCFQTNKRGIIFGIKYFYEGDENWETNFQNQNLPITKVGKDAEIGCIGCAWYDIQTWRESLNQFILDSSKQT